MAFGRAYKFFKSIECRTRKIRTLSIGEHEFYFEWRTGCYRLWCLGYKGNLCQGLGKMEAGTEDGKGKQNISEKFRHNRHQEKWENGRRGVEN